MWSLLKGVKNGLRFALESLVFEIYAILEVTLYSQYVYLPLIFNSRVSSVGKSSGIPRLTELASELQPVQVQFPVGSLLDGATCIFLLLVNTISTQGFNSYLASYQL